MDAACSCVNSSEGENSAMIGTLLYVVASLAVLLDLTFAAPSADVDKRQTDTRGRCNVNGYTYAHGQIFTIPGLSRCLKYRCSNGGWDIYEGGCEHQGRCHPVGSSFEDQCRTYTCTTSQRNGFTFYQPIQTRSRCKDYYGNCHEPGANNRFSYAINGRLYNNCQCTIQGNGFTNYSCSWEG